MNRFRLSLTILFLLLAQIGAAQTREKIRVALGSISVNTSVIPIGHQFGIFAKYGVDLEPIYMGGGMNSLAAVTSNSVQFLSAGSTATISARLGANAGAAFHGTMIGQVLTSNDEPPPPCTGFYCTPM